MKSTIIKSNVAKDGEYPCLKSFRGVNCKFVVLFTRKGTGMVVSSSDDPSRIGEYSREWKEKVFENFYGQVVLES